MPRDIFPVSPINPGGNPPTDPRMITEILSSQKKWAEQGSSWLSQYGGPQKYVELGRMPRQHREVFQALQEGSGTTPEEVAGWVDNKISPDQANTSIRYLVAKGFLNPSILDKPAPGQQPISMTFVYPSTPAKEKEKDSDKPSPVIPDPTTPSPYVETPAERAARLAYEDEVKRLTVIEDERQRWYDEMMNPGG